MTKVNINSRRIMNNMKKKAYKKLDEFSDEFKNKVDEKTPENTKKLLWNTKKGKIFDLGASLHTRVYNNTEYAKYVEYGVSRIFRYNKPKWKVFYRWEGAWMFGRTVHEMRDKLKTKLQ